jgi:hypothetical protein
MSSRPAHLRGGPAPADAKRRGPLLSPLHKVQSLLKNVAIVFGAVVIVGLNMCSSG